MSDLGYIADLEELINSRTFIDDYAIKGEEIHIRLGTGEMYIVPNTQYNLDNTIAHIRRQRKKILEEKDEMIAEQKRCNKKSILFLFICILSVILSRSGLLNSSSAVLANMLGGICELGKWAFIGASACCELEAKKYKNGIRELEKSEVFLKLERAIAKGLDTKTIGSGLSKEAKEAISAVPLDFKTFKDMRLKEYKQLRDNLKNMLGETESVEIKDEEKPKRIAFLPTQKGGKRLIDNKR